MPQKPNGFFFYMRTMKQENPAWKNKGYPELSTLCSDGWNALDQDEKEYYTAMKDDYDGFVKPKKKNKVKANGEVDERALDCLGRPIMQQKRSDEDDMKVRRAEVGEIRKIVKQARRITTEEFYIVYTTNYCITKHEPIEYCPAEISIGKFNIRSGFLEEVFQSFIKADVPLGYKLTIQQNCKDVLKIPFDLNIAKPMNYVVTGLRHVQDMILENTSPDFPEAILFCHDEEIDICRKNMERLNRDEEVGAIFEVYSITELILAILSALEIDIGLTSASFSMMIHQTTRELDFGDGCSWHEENSDMGLCSTSVLRKWCKSITELIHPLIKKKANP